MRWAEEEGERLRAECKRREELYKREWLEKEVLLDQAVRSEQAWQERRQAVLSGAADVVVAADATADATVEANEDTEDPMAVDA